MTRKLLVLIGLIVVACGGAKTRPDAAATAPGSEPAADTGEARTCTPITVEPSSDLFEQPPFREDEQNLIFKACFEGEVKALKAGRHRQCDRAAALDEARKLAVEEICRYLGTRVESTVESSFEELEQPEEGGATDPTATPGPAAAAGTSTAAGAAAAEGSTAATPSASQPGARSPEPGTAAAEAAATSKQMWERYQSHFTQSCRGEVREVAVSAEDFEMTRGEDCRVTCRACLALTLTRDKFHAILEERAERTTESLERVAALRKRLKGLWDIAGEANAQSLLERINSLYENVETQEFDKFRVRADALALELDELVKQRRDQALARGDEALQRWREQKGKKAKGAQDHLVAAAEAYREALAAAASLTGEPEVRLDAHARLARAALDLERLQEAEEHARASWPDMGQPAPERIRLLADVLYARGEFDQAEKQYRDLLEVAPDCRVRAKLAKLYLEVRFFRKFVEALGEAAACEKARGAVADKAWMNRLARYHKKVSRFLDSAAYGANYIFADLAAGGGEGDPLSGAVIERAIEAINSFGLLRIDPEAKAVETTVALTLVVAPTFEKHLRLELEARDKRLGTTLALEKTKLVPGEDRTPAGMQAQIVAAVRRMLFAFSRSLIAGGGAPERLRVDLGVD